MEYLKVIELIHNAAPIPGEMYMDASFRMIKAMEATITYIKELEFTRIEHIEYKCPAPQNHSAD